MLNATVACFIKRRHMLEPLLDDWQVAEITGRARTTLQKDRVAGTGISFVRVGRLVRYRPEDVAAWLASLPSYRSTSEPQPPTNACRR